MARSASDSTSKHRLSVFARFEINQEQDQFLENFAMLVGSGMGVLVALDAVRAEVRTSGMKGAIDLIRTDIDAGKPIWEAFQRIGFLRPHVISLIRIGEEAGRLPENLTVISIQQQKERSFRSKLISAMLYPLLVFAVTIIVGIVIAWFVLPRLATVFGQLNVELPAITKLVIAFGEFLGRYGILVIPLAILGILVLFWLLFVNERTKVAGEHLLRVVPGVQRVVQEIEVARFSYILGNLLEAGLPVVDALRSIVDATPVITYRRLFKHLEEKVDQGNSFKKSFASYPQVDRLIPVSIQQIIVAAEQSGTLPKALVDAGRRYEEKTDLTTKNLVVVLEPVLLVVVWLGVVLVAVAVILPIYRLVGEFNASTAGTTPVPAVSAGQATGHVLGSTDPATSWLVTPNEASAAGTIVRDRPSVAGQQVGVMLAGELVVAHQRAGDWYRVPGGWVNAATVTVVDDETLPAVDQEE